MRILVEPALGIGDADQRQQLDGAGARGLLVHVEMDGERLGDLQADPEHRIERGHRLLEDHGDLPAADAPHLLVREPQKLAPAKADRATGTRRAGGEQLHDGQRRYRLAGARLADDGHHLAGVHGVAQALDGPHGAVRGDELHIEIVDLEEGFAASRNLAHRRRFSQRRHVEGRDDLVVQLVSP
jgi:hypothetical protein